MRATRKKVSQLIPTSFFRKLSDWVFGHSEDQKTFMPNAICLFRYSSIDLVPESFIKHADFHPNGLFIKLLCAMFQIKEPKAAVGWVNKNSFEVFQRTNFKFLKILTHVLKRQSTIFNIAMMFSTYSGTDPVQIYFCLTLGSPTIFCL